MIGCPGWAEQRLGREELADWQSLARKGEVWICNFEWALARGCPLSKFSFIISFLEFLLDSKSSWGGVAGRDLVGKTAGFTSVLEDFFWVAKFVMAKSKSFTEFPDKILFSSEVGVEIEIEQTLGFISAVSWICLVAVTIFLSVLRDFLAIGLASMGGTSWAAS